MKRDFDCQPHLPALTSYTIGLFNSVLLMPLGCPCACQSRVVYQRHVILCWALSEVLLFT